MDDLFHTFSVDRTNVLASDLSQSVGSLCGHIGLCLFSKFYLEVLSVIKSLFVFLKLFVEIDGRIEEIIVQNINFALKTLSEEDGLVLYVRYLPTDQFQRVDGILTSNRLLIEAPFETKIKLQKIGWNGGLNSFDKSSATSLMYYCYQEMFRKYIEPFHKLQMEVRACNSLIYPNQDIVWTYTWDAYFEERWLDDSQILKDIASINAYFVGLTTEIKSATESQEALSVQLDSKEKHPLILFCESHSLDSPTPLDIKNFWTNITRFERKNNVHQKKHGTSRASPFSIFMNDKLMSDIKKYESLVVTVFETDKYIKLLRDQKRNVQKFLRATQNVSIFKSNSQGMKFDKKLMEDFMNIVEEPEIFVKVAGGGGGGGGDEVVGGGGDVGSECVSSILP
jgi:hypothetical protein